MDHRFHRLLTVALCAISVLGLLNCGGGSGSNDNGIGGGGGWGGYGGELPQSTDDTSGSGGNGIGGLGYGGNNSNSSGGNSISGIGGNTSSGGTTIVPGTGGNGIGGNSSGGSSNAGATGTSLEYCNANGGLWCAQLDRCFPKNYPAMCMPNGPSSRDVLTSVGKDLAEGLDGCTSDSTPVGHLYGCLPSGDGKTCTAQCSEPIQFNVDEEVIVEYGGSRPDIAQTSDELCTREEVGYCWSSYPDTTSSISIDKPGGLTSMPGDLLGSCPGYPTIDKGVALANYCACNGLSGTTVYIAVCGPTGISVSTPIGECPSECIDLYSGCPLPSSKLTPDQGCLLDGLQNCNDDYSCQPGFCTTSCVVTLKE